MVYNHLHTVHAIACCNAAETAMGADVSHEPSTPREGHHVASRPGRVGTTGLRTHHRGVDIVVPVSVIDRDGNEVVHADITTWVTPAG